MQWKDTTRYFRSEAPGRDPARAWTTGVGHVRLTVVFDHDEHPRAWSIRTRLPGLRVQVLHAQTVEEAKAEALQLLKNWLEHELETVRAAL